VEPYQVSNQYDNRRKEFFVIDKFSLRSTEDRGPICEQSLTLTSSNLSFFSQASSTIETNGTINLYGGGDFLFRAGEKITLKPGFQVINGTQFTAENGACEDSNGRLGKPIDDYDNYKLDYTISKPANSILPQDLEHSAELHQDQLTVFPNPANRELNISGNWSNESQTLISITNVWGIEIERKILSVSRSIDLKLSIESFASGVYILNVTRNEKKYRRKFVKQ
jgi:hypothetical protein